VALVAYNFAFFQVLSEVALCEEPVEKLISSSNGAGDEIGFSARGGHLQHELLLYVPHGDAPVPRARGEPDGGGAGRGPQGEGDGESTGEAAGAQPRCAGSVHRRQARRLHRQGHVASPERQPRSTSAQCRRALGVAVLHIYVASRVPFHACYLSGEETHGGKYVVIIN
jgi:hypothetical protein